MLAASDPALLTTVQPENKQTLKVCQAACKVLALLEPACSGVLAHRALRERCGFQQCQYLMHCSWQQPRAKQYSLKQ